MWPYVFIVSGIAVLIYGIGLVIDARNCAKWPTAKGEITKSEPEVVGREKDRRTYAANIAYTYAVNGTRYDGVRITLVPRNYTQLSGVQSALAQFPVGGAVNVFHDPKDPSNSVLLTTSTGTEWAYPIAGVVFLILGLSMFRGE
jgi:hypothetical protein